MKFIPIEDRMLLQNCLTKIDTIDPVFFERARNYLVFLTEMLDLYRKDPHIAPDTFDQAWEEARTYEKIVRLLTEHFAVTQTKDEIFAEANVTAQTGL